MSERVKIISQLHPFEEVVGILHELVDDGGVLVAMIGEICVALPWELEEKIDSLIGHKIGVLRTDLLKKPYLWRLLDDKVMTDGGCNESKAAVAA
jgi:hypothetical protein